MWPFTSPSPSTASPSTTTTPNTCPVDHSTRQSWLDSTQLQEDPSAASASAPTLRDPNNLSTERQISSIPRWLPPAHSSPSNPNADSDSTPPPTACPARSAPVSSSSSSSAPSSSSPSSPSPSSSSSSSPSSSSSSSSEENWVYPSPSSFYSALARKNRITPSSAGDMNTVVPIHNAVNERVWEEVMRWEREATATAERGAGRSSGRGESEGERGAGRENDGETEGKGKTANPNPNPGSKLVSFVGKPKDLSPRARWKTLIGYTAPFDRHDWIVDRPLPSSSSSPSSMRIRYVIDFYTGRSASLLSSSPAPSSPFSGEGGKMPNLAFYIDVRPALDSWEGVRMRWTRFWGGLSGFGVSGSGSGPGTRPPGERERQGVEQRRE